MVADENAAEGVDATEDAWENAPPGSEWGDDKVDPP